MQLWNSYFTNPEIILGLAYGSSTENVEDTAKSLESVTVYFRDQSKPETMKYIKSLAPWDVIINDGSHEPTHIVYSFF